MNLYALVGMHAVQGSAADGIPGVSQRTGDRRESPREPNGAPICGGLAESSRASEVEEQTLVQVAVVGTGGIARLAIHFSRAFGCEVTAFCLTPGQDEKARRVGAQHVYSCTDQESLQSLAGAFDCLMLTDDQGALSEGLLRTLRKGGAVCSLDFTGEEASIESLVRSVGEVVNHLESGTVRPDRNA